MSSPEIERPKAIPLADLPRDQDCDFFCYVLNREPLLTRSGKPYLRVTIRDATRSITFPIWRDAPWWPACDEALQIGDFCKVRAVYHESAYGPQFEIRKIRPATQADADAGFDPTKLLPPPRGDSLALLTEVRRIAEAEISSNPLRQLTCELLDIYKDGWLSQAGGRWHHAQHGGLIEHSYFTLRTAIAMWDQYAIGEAEAERCSGRDLVIAGAILHDIGRIAELHLDPQGASMTTSGELVGHQVLGRDLVRAAACKTGVDADALLRLEHILLSHHARSDFGSPMPPMTLEALIVHLADDADARIVAALEVMQAEQNSDWTSRRNPTGQKWYRGAPSKPDQPEPSS